MKKPFESKFVSLGIVAALVVGALVYAGSGSTPSETAAPDQASEQAQGGKAALPSRTQAQAYAPPCCENGTAGQVAESRPLSTLTDAERAGIEELFTRYRAEAGAVRNRMWAIGAEYSRLGPNPDPAKVQALSDEMSALHEKLYTMRADVESILREKYGLAARCGVSGWSVAGGQSCQSGQSGCPTTPGAERVCPVTGMTAAPSQCGTDSAGHCTRSASDDCPVGGCGS